MSKVYLISSTDGCPYEPSVCLLQVVNNRDLAKKLKAKYQKGSKSHEFYIEEWEVLGPEAFSELFKLEAEIAGLEAQLEKKKEQLKNAQTF